MNRVSPETFRFSHPPPLTRSEQFWRLKCHIWRSSRGQCSGISSTPRQDDYGIPTSDPIRHRVWTRDRLLSQLNLTAFRHFGDAATHVRIQSRVLLETDDTTSRSRRSSTGGPTPRRLRTLGARDSRRPPDTSKLAISSVSARSWVCRGTEFKSTCVVTRPWLHIEPTTLLGARRGRRTGIYHCYEDRNHPLSELNIAPLLRSLVQSGRGTGCVVTTVGRTWIFPIGIYKGIDNRQLFQSVTQLLISMVLSLVWAILRYIVCG